MERKSILKEFKNHILLTIKESLKFALLAMSILLLIGLPLAYISIYILKLEGEIPPIIIGIIVAIIIFIIDNKKLHAMKKIHEDRIEIWKKSEKNLGYSKKE